MVWCFLGAIFSTHWRPARCRDVQEKPPARSGRHPTVQLTRSVCGCTLLHASNENVGPIRNCGRGMRVSAHVGIAWFVLVAGTAAAQPPSRPMPVLPLTQLDEHTLAADLDNRTFTLTFAQPVAVRELLLLLVRGTNLSIVPDPSISGTFIGELKNVTVRQALSLILPPLGLQYSVDGIVRPGVRARAGNADLRRQLRGDRAHLHRHGRWRQWRTRAPPRSRARRRPTSSRTLATGSGRCCPSTPPSILTGRRACCR